MPNPLVTRERVEQEVRNALATTLRTEADEIDMNTSIINGLHATSIDFLDINFRLESVFGIQLATQLLLDHAEEEFGEGKAIDRDNKITPAALTLLKTHLGELEGLARSLDHELVVGVRVGAGPSEPVTEAPERLANERAAAVLAWLAPLAPSARFSTARGEQGGSPDGDPLTVSAAELRLALHPLAPASPDRP